MSLPDAASPRNLGLALLTGLILALPLLSACQVRPLYSAPTVAGDVGTDLSSIAVKPVDTRYAQQVRNHLIFLFNGGRGQPAAPRYSLQLQVARLKESGAVVQVGDRNEPTAGTMTLIADYVLTDLQAATKDSADGLVVTNGRRQIAAAYDIPLQEFAAVRAERDAEDRAARELAELLRLAIAQDLARMGR
jgi:LPS-assembly lipoprotein